MSDDDASHAAAKTALRAGRFDEALKLYSELAAAGSPEAWINLGWMYQHGKGVVKDLTEAERYNQKAFLEYSKLAEAGSWDAWNYLGWMHEHGAGLPRNLLEAQSCYRKAAELGDVGAQRSLARVWCSEDPLHTAAKAALRSGKFDEALKRYSELSASGSPEAWLNLGWMYQHGKGVPIDLADAQRYYRQAFLEYSKLAASGEPEAWNTLGWMHEHGPVPDLVEAQSCYRKAVALGAVDAHYSLARLLAENNDYQCAFPFLAAAADKGHVESTYWLGRLYLKGTGVEKDVRKAQGYLKQAADMGHLYARRDYHLGLLRGTFGQRELLSGLIGWLRALLALRRLRSLWARGIWYSKVIGLAFLAAYFFYYPFHFEGVWVAAAIAIPLGVSVVFATAFYVVERFVPSQRSDKTTGLTLMGLFWKRPLRELLLLPGEDGFFFVPLLLVGITPISAALFSVAYGGAHYPLFSLRYCVCKSVFLFLIAMIVLPHGLAPVIVAHVVSDATVFLVGRKVFLNEPTAAAS